MIQITTSPRSVLLGLSLLTAATALLGCGDMDWFGGRNRELPPEPEPRKITRDDPLLADTIGTLAVFGSADPREVKGFGLVVGLDGTGSRTVASSIRNYLVDRMQKMAAARAWSIGREADAINQMIESPDTAVVELTAYVPPGAREGRTLDLTITAARGTETTSLDGGLLLPSELKIVGVASSGAGILTGRTIGIAEGPVFVSPFTTQAATGPQSDERRGFVLGGLMIEEGRPLRLVIRQPSYPTARRIEQRVNERFGMSPPVAEPMSHSYLTVNLPPRYNENYLYFMRLLGRVYMPNNPAFFDARLQVLDEYAARPGIDHENLALAWEGIGKRALPHVQRFYDSADPALRFYAARAGLHLEDVRAIGVLGAMANEAEHPFQLQAARALAKGPLRHVALELLPLLEVDDPEVRAEAYEGLLTRGHRAIRRSAIPYARDANYVNLYLDRVDAGNAPLIYARRSRAPRIALFGGHLPIRTPLFMKFDRKELLLNSSSDGALLTVLARIMPEGPMETFQIRPRVADLVAILAQPPSPGPNGAPVGVGMSYSAVLNVIAALREDGAITAPLVFEKTSLRDLMGPSQPGGRPEADLPTLEEYEASLQELDRLEDEEPPAEDPPAERDSMDALQERELRRSEMRRE